MVRFHPHSPMEEEKKDIVKGGKMDWSPIILFYVKTTSWIIIPLVVAIIASKKIAPAHYLLFVIIGFGVTCFGINKEIKQYKEDLKKHADKNIKNNDNK